MKINVIEIITQRVKRSRIGVFLRKEFNDLGSYHQVSKALSQLIEMRVVIRAGHGVYAKSALASNPDLIAERLYKKLGPKVDRKLLIGVSLLHMGEITTRANAQIRLDLLKLLIARWVVEKYSTEDIRNKSLQNLARWKANGVWNSGYEQWERLLLHASDADIHEVMTSEAEEPCNRLRQSPPYVGLVDSKTIRRLRREEQALTLLQIKKAGQERCRQLVRDGTRSQESMFLFPKEVVKNSKVKWRGL